MAKPTEQRRLNLDPRGGPLYVVIREGEDNKSDHGYSKGTVYGGNSAPATNGNPKPQTAST